MQSHGVPVGFDVGEEVNGVWDGCFVVGDCVGVLTGVDVVGVVEGECVCKIIGCCVGSYDSQYGVQSPSQFHGAPICSQKHTYQ